jgi:hypothetical protein
MHRGIIACIAFKNFGFDAAIDYAERVRREKKGE